MSKKEITYIGLVKVMLDKARKEADAAGADFDQKSAFKSAAARWKKVKDGSDTEYSPGKAAPGTRKKKSKNSKKSGKKSEEETVLDNKGAPSETFSEDRVEGKPYSDNTHHPKTAKDVLDIIDKCLEEGVSLQQCRDRVAAAMKKKSQKKLKSKKTRKTQRKGQ